MQNLPFSISDFKQLGHDALILPTVESAGLEVLLALDLHYLSDGSALRTVFIQIADEMLLLALQVLQTSHKSVISSVALASSANGPAETLKCDGRLFVLPDAKVLIVRQYNVINDFLSDLL